MSVISRRTFATVVLPITLCSGLASVGHASEESTLNRLIANVLEREGIIEPGTAPSTRAQELPPAPATMDTAAARISAMDTEVTLSQAAPITSLILIFADPEARELSRQNLPPPDALIEALQQASGITLNFRRAMSMDAFVFDLEQPLSHEEFNALQQQLTSLPIVEALYPDQQQMPQAVPLRSHYYYYQWSLLPTNAYSDSLGGSVVGTDVQSAWDLITGSRDITVAVLDTGLTNPHPVDPSRLLPGYDFISDPETARDGDGRDADPTDMGDYRADGECDFDENASNSSWHGTAVTSVIAADGNIRSGMAGIDWHAGILPLRVMGKCGGITSDVVDAMLWAAGLTVPGVPDNPHPAHILNMSLGRLDEDGDRGACHPLYERAFRMLRTRNVLVITAAGNDGADIARYAPANCQGALAVSSVTHEGKRSLYSNWSTEGEIFIAAPGGDISKNKGWAGILVTKDTGDTTPEGELQHTFTSGTSVSTAHVSGVASLAWGVDPAQRPDVIAAILQETVQPFPRNTRCDLEWPLCGPGIIDAWAAVQGAMAMKSYSSVVEFYHPDLKHYFNTANYDEVSLVRAGNFGDWNETPRGFITWRGPSETGVLPVCRFYGTPGIGPNSHFYTVDPEECKKVKLDPGWTYEGVPFYAKRAWAGNCPVNSAPVYRYYNNGWQRNDSNHRYATDLKDRAAMEAAGWTMEGVAMCVPD